MKRCLCAAALLFPFAVAADKIDAKTICIKEGDRYYADKDLLAAEILQHNSIPLTSLVRAEKPANTFGLRPSIYLLATGGDACKDIPCDDDAKEHEKLIAAKLIMRDLAEDRYDDGYKLEGIRFKAGEMPVPIFFSDNSARLRCLQLERPGQTAPTPVSNSEDAPSKPYPSLRVRSSADDLYLSRKSHPALFKSVDKATLSFSQDDENKKRVRKISGVIGLSIPLSEKPLFPGTTRGYSDLVPYLGIVSTITKKGGSPSEVGENLRQFGVAYQGYSWSESGYWWSIRPQLTHNLNDDSKLFTTALRFRPVLLGKLNSNFSKNGKFSYHWLLDARFNHGRYTSLGHRGAELDNESYNRLGAQVGFSVAHNSDATPWSWTVKDTWYYDFSGSNRTIGQFESVFSYSFDKLQLMGIDLTYTNGRDGETGERDKSWSIDLGFRY